MKSGRAQVAVLRTDSNWFGVTYQEDKLSVVEKFRELIAEGVYKEKLFE